jgi:nicotinamidase-related amidase
MHRYIALSQFENAKQSGDPLPNPLELEPLQRRILFGYKASPSNSVVRKEIAMNRPRFLFSVLIIVLALAFSVAPAAQKGPNRPVPKTVTLDAKTGAILVLDLNARCEDPKQVCSKLMQGVGTFLERARKASVPILYTVSDSAKGKPIGEIAKPLKRRPEEPVLYPRGFDKFFGGELDQPLKAWGTKTVVCIGSSSNVAVMYTATTAARMYEFDVIIPIDGMNTRSDYEQEYTFHQLSVLRGGAEKRIHFTTLEQISFK